ncbi:hypothetical protein JCM13210_18320 [Thermaerobacter litoralis]
MDGVSALTRPSWLWIAVLAATLVVAPVLAWQLAPVDPREREARALERALRCPVCEGQSVADSNSAVALEMRQEIRRLLAEGRSRDEILQSFADRYGAWVVYMPPRSGWYLLGWAAPFLAVAGGAGLLAWWWRGRRAAPGAIAVEPAVDPAAGPDGGSGHPGDARGATPAARPGDATPGTAAEGGAGGVAGEGGGRSAGSSDALADALRRWM